MLGTPAQATCRLALALGFDVSHSVDAADYEIQRSGIIAALSAPEIRLAFLQPANRVALAIYEWGGHASQSVVLDWTMIKRETDLDAVIALMAARQRDPHWQPTALGQSLIFAEDLLARAPACFHQTLDVSGDGRNNDGPGPADVYADHPFCRGHGERAGNRGT